MSLKEILKEDSKRVVAVHSALRRIVTPLPDLLLISQILFWGKVKNPFYKTNVELSYETGLTKSEIDYIKKRLINYKFIKVTYKGVPRRTYYHIDWELLDRLLSEAPELKNVGIKNMDSTLTWATTGTVKSKRKSNLSSDTSKTRQLDLKDSIPDTSKTRQLGNNDPVPVTELSRSLDTSKTRPLDASNSRQQDAELSRPLYRDNTENTTDINTEIRSTNGIHSSAKQIIDVSTLEDKPQGVDTNFKRKEYSVGFNIIWSKYKPRHTKAKGSKANAYKAFLNVSQKFSDEEIIELVEIYMDSSMFQLGQAHLSTFLNGLITDTKYREEFIEGGYAHRLEKVKNNRRSNSPQEEYRQNLARQGELNTNELMDRTAHISVMLSIKYNIMMSVIEQGEREEWLPLIGPDYVAIPIKHPLSKTDKTKVLFHIDELRSNQYVHLHGHEWSEHHESKYQESNKNIKWVDTLQLPNKEEYIK